MADTTIAHRTAAAPAPRVLLALCAALAVGALVLSIQLILVAALTWGSIGLFGLSPLAAWIGGGLVALAALWASWRLALSAYRLERAGLKTGAKPLAGEEPACSS